MKNTAIIGLQWGDEGKGKIVDFLADKFDAVVRFQGGHNAGHTIKANGQTYKLNLLPSGVVQKKFSVIGSGVVVDPAAFLNEVEKIAAQGVVISPENLVIADNVSLIFSIHRQLDLVLEEKRGGNKIGTTGRGIGPAYEDRVGRRSIRLCDLSDDKILQEAAENLTFYHNFLRSGLGLLPFSAKDLLAEIEPLRQKILPFMLPAFEISKHLQKCKAVMFEGAQGSLLDVYFGTYPFVTSSNISAGQVAIGSCLGIKDVNEVIGILKAYTTRVGAGPFPTELCDETGEYLRNKGNEFGTVTGRNRRCGWFDAALVRQAIHLSSVSKVALTKLDVLDDLPVVKICTGYKIEGQNFDYFPSAKNLWSKIEPIFLEMPGWQSSTVGLTDFSQLPENAKKYINKIEEICGIKIAIISTGAKREETILVNFQ